MLKPLPLSQILWGHSLFTLMLALWLLVVFAAGFGHNLLAWSAGLLYIFYDTALQLFIALKTYRLGNTRDSNRDQTASPLIPIAILIPSRNEASVLATTLEALLPQLRQNDEVLILNDGSTDRTASLLQDFGIDAPNASAAATELFQSTRYPQLRLLNKPNSGKANSLNLGLRQIQSPLVVTLDADTCLEPGALDAIRNDFSAKPNLVAAGGIIIPQCRAAAMRWFFQWFQTFEYIRGFLSRAAWAKVNGLLLVSGAFAIYRRSALEAVAGFDPQSLVEDYEINHRLHRYAREHNLEWEIGVLGSALARTDAPASFKTFFAQRARWFAGFLETQFRNTDMIGNKKYGSVGRLMLPLKSVDTLQPLFGMTAIILLLYYLLTFDAILPYLLGVVSVKLGIDFIYSFWALHRYFRWLGRPLPARLVVASAIAALAEPFSFQFVRHMGAILGWVGLLRGRIRWTPQREPVNLKQEHPEEGFSEDRWGEDR